MARLILESGGERREYGVTAPVVIGRGKTNPIVLEDRLLSREHTKINVEPAPGGARRFVLQDLRSRNGTFLNGRKLVQPEMLKHGDLIRVGSMHLRFIVEAGDQGKAPTAASPPSPTTKKAATGQKTSRKVGKVLPPGRRSTAAAIVAAQPAAAVTVVRFVLLLLVFAAGTLVFRGLFCWFIRSFLQG